MHASSAHLSVRQPHLASEFSRNLLPQGPPATIIRATSTNSNNGGVSADDQLYAIREDPSLGDRGVPVMGLTRVSGVMRGTRPTDCLDRVARLQLLWSLAASGATPTTM